ncbi:MAG: molybdopterin biosynthesis protein [Chloroflexi bacterium]|nr:molybdopterin biosynthesis protein [Chloroflexota bacterium]
MPERNIYLEDIPLDDALVILFYIGQRGPLPTEDLPLKDALGRVTAEPIWAKLSSPHYHAAAMDGYAVRASDTLNATETRPVSLTVNRQAYPVNTGDPMPADTDAVIMIEHVEEGDKKILIRAPVAPRQHVRLMGEDMVATELVLPANHQLRPVDLGAIAGCGHHTVTVYQKPHVHIIPTGSELVPITQSPEAGEIIEYNSLVLSAQIEEIGGRVSYGEMIPDSVEHLREALQEAVAANPDLILVLSGSSAGSRDFTAHVLQEMGTLEVHGVAVRPGHPVIIGSIKGIPVMGVPGYPVSAALTGEIFIQPLLAKWLGISPPHSTNPRVEAVMTRKLVSHTGDDDFVRVALAQVGDKLLATPLTRGAGVITSLVRADGLAHIPRFSEGVDMGQPVTVMLYRPLHLIQKTIFAMGSHDPMLDLLSQYIAARYPDIRFTSANVGSMGGLIALKRGEAHLAGSHLLDPATGDYNLPYLDKYLGGIPVRVITFAHREQGMLVAKGNPQNIEALSDLVRVRFVNRQRGSGTRMLLDYELAKLGITADDIAGYEHEEVTHLAVATAIASGIADCGLGVRRAALALNLDFIPVGWERYDLIIPEASIDHVAPLIETLHDEGFREALAAQPGYDIRETGVTLPT